MFEERLPSIPERRRIERLRIPVVVYLVIVECRVEPCGRVQTLHSGRRPVLRVLRTIIIERPCTVAVGVVATVDEEVQVGSIRRVLQCRKGSTALVRTRGSAEYNRLE